MNVGDVRESYVRRDESDSEIVDKTMTDMDASGEF